MLFILIIYFVFGSNVIVGIVKVMSFFVRLFFGIMFNVMYDWIRIGI